VHMARHKPSHLRVTSDHLAGRDSIGNG
jgi:hypothetical protein